ncbi:hypothetical protein LY90DRAFT_707756 [Neocallimastix californiae]|jgi:hypothetical protein|uniref:G-protein coupled receptors family 3 profile domain-containing protein n=1 Tax=Neocallimastix californiae TaxID=1754190 RepID=A0A1Y2AE44_9FUNG|nr:hypothetical protein LY90DRAFT_707756 [Neocallimastix californiae]|eukprot:ORY20744.1 hypothetical protein LY90DRAFT_707756 [Neocallimastix californiae]
MIGKKLLNFFFIVILLSHLLFIVKAEEEDEEEEEDIYEIKTCSKTINIDENLANCGRDQLELYKNETYCIRNSVIYELGPDLESVNCKVILKITDNDSRTIATRFVSIGVALSWYIYGKYALLSFIGLKRHKNYNFLFPFTAALFAFVNNFNDLVFNVYHPESKETCENVFLRIFIGSATLNWAPISWLQACRLAVIANIYLPKKGFIIITAITCTLSCVYCAFYFCNLSLFNATQSQITGCGVTNPGTYSYYVMISDIVDSAFAFTAIVVLIYRSIKGLRELNTRNQKLNDLASQGVLELLIITLAKIVIYPLIALTSEIPALDIFWDVLSVIVIICGYNLVNFPYAHSQTKDDKKMGGITRNIFTFIETTVNYSFTGTNTRDSSHLSSGSLKDTTKSYNKSEVVTPNSALKNEVV